jgi:N-methylhydantoinase A
MHAAALGAAIGVDRVLVPREPGLLSAVGTLVAGLRVDRAQTVLGVDAVEDAATLAAIWRRLEEEALTGLEEAGVARKECELRRRVDLRYRGQSFELTVDAPANGGSTPEDEWMAARDRFAAAHLERYGYDRPGIAVELVSLRVEGHGPGAADLDELLPRIDGRGAGEQGADSTSFPTRAMIWDGASHEAPQIPRERLSPGQIVTGPLLIHEFSATTVVPPGAAVEVGSWGDLLITLDQQG